MSSHDTFGPAWNFLGMPAELAAPGKARAWVMSIPYESTTSYGAGTRNGPSAIIAASRQVELFDREFDCEPAEKIGFHTLDPLNLVHTSPEAMVESIENGVAQVLTGTPAPELLIVFGGEHSVSPGVVRGLKRARNEDDAFVAAFYALAAGDRRLADEHLRSCPSRAADIDALFEPAAE